ncbi:MAG TPA: hypothetical protein PKD09_18920 [Aggregatilinea sp.]|uniref:hypothetical protein n=1 Tax=Aggregatilinea TaxID=2806306 RepID=UPI000E5AEB28|nr:MULTISPECIES: hypothetical protein [Aggregatilinea]HML23736.1 hypothetical protein [Aggregatilinea sp.]
MSTLEQEIIEKFQQLNTQAKQRVLAQLEGEMQATFDYARWWSDVETLQSAMQKRLGEHSTTGALSLLDDLREEAS